MSALRNAGGEAVSWLYGVFLSLLGLSALLSCLLRDPLEIEHEEGRPPESPNEEPEANPASPAVPRIVPRIVRLFVFLHRAPWNPELGPSTVP